MSIKQAIEALESCAPGDYSTGHVIHPSYDEEKVNAALAALRSMPQGEPVEVLRSNDEVRTIEFDAPVYIPPGCSLAIIATPHTEAVRMSEAEVICTCAAKDMPFGRCCKLAPLLGEAEIMAAAKQAGFNLNPTPNMLFTVRGNAAQIFNLARAVEQATAARLGVKMGDARHADQA